MIFPHAMKTRSRLGGVLAMTLVEMMVATGIGSIVLAAVATLSMYGARSFVAMGNYGDLDRVSRNALDLMSREIRQTRGLTNFTSTALSFRDFDGFPLVYKYDPTARTLSRVKTNSTRVLLEQCDYLKFNISQRNPSNNFEFYATTNLKVVKLIDLSWRCSRTILGAKVNTESVQTAKIVIRN
jgi:hypothetical protein